MRVTRHTTDMETKNLRSPFGTGPVQSIREPSHTELEEFVRLARTVLQKSPDDLYAIADNNLAMQRAWIAAFVEHRARAEAEAQFWSAAIAYLMSSTPAAAANDP